jgi:hypothetical protein
MLLAGSCGDGSAPTAPASTTDAGQPEADAPGAGAGAYEDCDDARQCAPDLFCQLDFGADGNVRWCAPTGCDRALQGADCPGGPTTGTAIPACGELDEGQPVCFLSCIGNRACPTGMRCNAVNTCGWPFE